MEPKPEKTDSQKFEDALGQVLRVPKSAIEGKKIRKPGKPTRPEPEKQPPWHPSN